MGQGFRVLALILDLGLRDLGLRVCAVWRVQVSGVQGVGFMCGPQSHHTIINITLTTTDAAIVTSNIPVNLPSTHSRTMSILLWLNQNRLCSVYRILYSLSGAITSPKKISLR